MALELLANNASDTLDGGIDNTSDPVVLTVNDASLFPATGNFRILIGTELLKVTAVSGNDFTAARAQEGTSIAAHSDTDVVTLVLTAAGLAQFSGEYHLAGLVSARPAASQYGRLFFPSDGGPVFRDTGSAWEVWAAGKGPFTPPLADFTTWVNQGTATVATSDGYTRLAIAGAAATPNLRMRVKTLPSTTFTMTLVYEADYPPGCNGLHGICLRNSSDGKVLTHSIHPSASAMADYTYSSPTAFNSNTFSDSVTPFSFGGLHMIRLRGDGTTYFFDYSTDGRNWSNNRQLTIATSYVPSPDQVGFFVNPGNARSTQTTALSVYHAVLS